MDRQLDRYADSLGRRVMNASGRRNSLAAGKASQMLLSSVMWLCNDEPPLENSKQVKV